jgi:hypothetical protein
MRRVAGRLAQGPALAVAASAVIVLAAGVLAAVTWAGGSAAGQASPKAGATMDGTPQPGAGSPGSLSASPSGGQQSPGQQGGQVTAGAGNVASVPMSALPSGSPGSGMIVALVIVTGVPSVSVNVAVMPGTLVQAATGGGYGARPVLDDLPGASQDQAAGMPGAAVVLSLAPAGAAGGGSQAGAALSVTLSPDVAWQLDFGGSAGPVTVDMTGGRIAGLDFAQGASDISVALPRPPGTVLLRLEGGASQLAVSVPAGVPARVTAGDGASQVTVGGASYSGIAAGTVIAQPGWAAATGRIDIDATSGVSRLQVTQR